MYPCHTNAVCSGNFTTSGFRSSLEEKRQSSTAVAASEYSAKFTPEPSHVAPCGYGLPGRTVRAILIRVLVCQKKDTQKAHYCDGGCRLKKEKNESRFPVNRTSFDDFPLSSVTAARWCPREDSNLHDLAATSS